LVAEEEATGVPIEGDSVDVVLGFFVGVRVDGFVLTDGLGWFVVFDFFGETEGTIVVDGVIEGVGEFDFEGVGVMVGVVLGDCVGVGDMFVAGIIAGADT